MSDDRENILDEIGDEQSASDEAVPGGRWLPEGRTLRDELRQPRYLIAAAVVLTIILLQIWVLF